MHLTPATRMGLSVGLATGLYGISFGALATASGLGVGQAQVLSLAMFTGGSQFAFVGSLAGGGPAAVLSATLVGLRNLVYGAQMNALFEPRGALRLAQAQLTIDESVATAVAQPDHAEQRRGFWTAGVAVFVLWNVFTLVGALLGNALGDPRAWGLDGAAVAAFLGLLWPRLHDRDAVAVAVAAAFTTMALLPVLPTGLPLVAAAVVSALVALARHGRAGA